jgi:hypothetical protein
MIVGCYTLDLYCDAPNCKTTQPETFIHELGSTCRSLARKAGWYLTGSGQAFCPTCTKKMKLRPTHEKNKE